MKNLWYINPIFSFLNKIPEIVHSINSPSDVASFYILNYGISSPLFRLFSTLIMIVLALAHKKQHTNHSLLSRAQMSQPRVLTIDKDLFSFSFWWLFSVFAAWSGLLSSFGQLSVHSGTFSSSRAEYLLLGTKLNLSHNVFLPFLIYFLSAQFLPSFSYVTLSPIIFQKWQLCSR